MFYYKISKKQYKLDYKKMEKNKKSENKEKYPEVRNSTKLNEEKYFFS